MDRREAFLSDAAKIGCRRDECELCGFSLLTLPPCPNATYTQLPCAIDSSLARSILITTTIIQDGNANKQTNSNFRVDNFFCR